MVMVLVIMIMMKKMMMMMMMLILTPVTTAEEEKVMTMVSRNVCCFVVAAFSFSGAPVARWTAKRSPITIETGSHACIEIETHATLFSW